MSLLAKILKREQLLEKKANCWIQHLYRDYCFILVAHEFSGESSGLQESSAAG
jgi:hypothetical protein